MPNWSNKATKSPRDVAPSREWSALLRAMEKHHPRVRVRTHRWVLRFPGHSASKAETPVWPEVMLESWLDLSAGHFQSAKFSFLDEYLSGQLVMLLTSCRQNTAKSNSLLKSRLFFSFSDRKS